MKLVTSILLSSLVLVSFVACSTKPAVLPNAVPKNGPDSAASFLQSRELELSQHAAQDAANSAQEAVKESEKIQRQLAELKDEVRKLSVLAAACSDMAKKGEQRRAALAAQRAKKEAEEKKAQEEAAVALPAPSAKINSGEYSKSDAPPGYYPEVRSPQAPPAAHDKH